jgi:hypothetical protein
MRDIKKHFLLNGKTYDNVDSGDKIILDKIFASVSDISNLLNDTHFMDFKIIDKENSKFEFNLPDSIISRVIEACILSKVD